MKKNSFQIFIKSNFNQPNFPLRLLKFKRQKWLPLQNRLHRLIKPVHWERRKTTASKLKPFQLLFKNPMYIQKPCSRWIKLKRAYSNEQITKRLFFILYQRAISRRFLRTQVKTGAFITHRLVGLFAKPFYRVDVLLRFLNFFTSVYQARQTLSRKKFLVNQSSVKASMFLGEDDCLEITRASQTPIMLAHLRKRYAPKKKVLTFIEVDYYTKTITVLKRPAELGPQELGLLFFNKINFRSFNYVF